MRTMDHLDIRRSAATAAVEALRTRILTGVLSPGEQIRQDDMAAQVGVSRLPLREALRTLSSQGLLTHRPNQGYFVTKLSGTELDQILQLLEFLETCLLATVEWPGADDLADLREINLAMSRAAAAADVDSQMQLNRDFHAAIYAMSTQQLFAQEVDRLSSLAEPYLRLRFTEADAARTVVEHAELIDALEAQDRSRCIAIQNEHRVHFSHALSQLLS